MLFFISVMASEMPSVIATRWVCYPAVARSDLAPQGMREAEFGVGLGLGLGLD